MYFDPVGYVLLIYYVVCIHLATGEGKETSARGRVLDKVTALCTGLVSPKPIFIFTLLSVLIDYLHLEAESIYLESYLFKETIHYVSWS